MDFYASLSSFDLCIDINKVRLSSSLSTVYRRRCLRDYVWIEVLKILVFGARMEGLRYSVGLTSVDPPVKIRLIG